MDKRRVVVTGLGMLTPLGITVEETWSNIVAGNSGIATVTSFDTTDLTVKFGGQLKGFVAEDYLNAKDVRKTDVFTQYGVAAAIEAINDSGLEVTDENRARIGVAVGSGIGGLDVITETERRLQSGGPRKVSPYFIPAGIINMVAGNISLRYGLQGPNISIVTACTTGTHNIGTAARMIQMDDADIMIAGGSEACMIRIAIAGFAAARALSTRNDAPERASRPWDQDRDGFVLGEGAGILILEELENAKKRGARIYAELTGYGMSADAYHITLPHPEGQGAYLSMANAVKDAKVSVEEIDYINAHGTSTPAGDEIEAKAVKTLLKDHAYKTAISSTKSMTGHLLGAAGAVEAIFCILAIRDQVAPPTINCDNPSPGCDLNFVPHTAQSRKINTVLSNSFGFGGTNGSVIFRKF